MRSTVYRCDGCKVKLSEGEDDVRERCFTLQSPFHVRALDICRDCWTKMCAAVGIDPDTKAGEQM